MSTLINLSDTTPPAAPGYTLGKWQKATSPSGTDPTTGAPYYDASVELPNIVSTVGITIDGGGATPATGSKGFIQVPFNGTLTSWTIIGDVSGSVSMDVKKSTFAAFPTNSSIVASAPPNLSAQQNATNSTLTGWTTTVTAGDVLEFVINSISTIKRFTLEIQIQRS